MTASRALLGLALLFAAPAFAEETPESTATVEISDALSSLQRAWKNGDKAGAATQAKAIISAAEHGSPTEATESESAAADTQTVGGAWIITAEILASYNLPYSAAIAYSNAFLAHPPLTNEHAAAALAQADKVADAELLGPALVAGLDSVSDGPTRAQVLLVAAREAFREGELGRAQELATQISKDAEQHVDAELLNGVVMAQQGRFNDALLPLIAARELGSRQGRGDRFRNLLDMNMARAYYAAGNYGRAVQSYETISRDSEYWPEAAFEMAWAHFRADDMQGTLGRLHTLQSPFFEGWYFPEADLLRVYALFMLCKFPEASDRIDLFEETYKPMLSEIDSVLASMSPVQAFDDVGNMVRGKSHRLPISVIRNYQYEDRFLDAHGAVAALDAEKGRLGGYSSLPLAQMAGTWLDERRAQMVTREGQRILDRGEHSRAELDDFLKGLEITRLDILSLEAELYERAARSGTLDYGDRIGKLRKAGEKGARVWPFQGEYWLDELGNYRVDARSDCPAELAVGD